MSAQRQVRLVPLERGRAIGILTGLVAFVVGFAVAGIAVLAGGGGGPVYLTGVAVGLAGVGVVGFFLNRGTVPLPQAAIWSPAGLRAVIGALELPTRPVMVALYGLGALGVIGNVLIPLLRR